MEELIANLTSEFKESVPEGNEELVNSFKEFLHNSVKTLKESDSKFIRKDDDFIGKTLSSMSKKIISSDLDSKKRLLIKDDSFEKIKQHSLKAYEAAESKFNGENPEIDFDVEEVSKELPQLLESVKDFNKGPAAELVSEGILDLGYLSNPDTKIFSLRIGRLIREKNIREKNNAKKRQEER